MPVCRLPSKQAPRLKDHLLVPPHAFWQPVSSYLFFSAYSCHTAVFPHIPSSSLLPPSVSPSCSLHWAFDGSTSRQHLVFCREPESLAAGLHRFTPFPNSSTFPLPGSSTHHGVSCSTTYTRFPVRSPGDSQSGCHSVQTRQQEAGVCEPRTRLTRCGRYQQLGSAEISDGPQLRLPCPFPGPDYTASLIPVSGDRYCSKPWSP